MLRSVHSLPVVLGALLASATFIHAQSTTFTFNDAFTQSGGQVVGTISIDTVNDLATGANFTVDGDAYTSVNFNEDAFGYEVFPGGFIGLPTYIDFVATNMIDNFYLYFPDIANLDGYTGGPLCTTASSVNDCAGAFLGPFQDSPSYQDTISGLDYLVSGSLVGPGGSTSATPEPSSLVLLGSGVISLAGAVRRRMRR